MPGQALGTNGRLAPGFAFSRPDEQRRILEAEGVRFLPDGRVDLASCRWEA
jgi:methylated-DNA-protein-cysteine methyltransferase-like protein